nr:hypothetical protein [Tanacetum cinerariifolium]
MNKCKSKTDKSLLHLAGSQPMLQPSKRLKKAQEKDKIKSKPDKNGKCGEARKSLKQLQWIKQEKPKKTQKEWSKTHARKTVASESNKKPRNNVKKLHERFGKIYKWSYTKFTPSGYMWKPKSPKGNVNPNVSMPLGNASRTANVKDTMTSRRSIVSNTPLSSNSFAAHRDCSIHRRLWVLKAHDGKYQASN